jgi:hypothetical protein
MRNYKIKRYSGIVKEFALYVYENKLILQVDGFEYTAKYPWIKEDYTLLDVNEKLFDLMMFVLLYKLDTIKLPEVESLVEDCYENVVSYSGGVDSTAALYLTGGVPIHIYRSFNENYENRQIRACDEVGALRVVTDFERVREVYGLRHGFNVGCGYASMYIPVLPILEANTIALGIVFDDLAFNYSDPFTYNQNFEKSGLFHISQVLSEYEIFITCPVAGLSEVLTVDIADRSGIKSFSSCHTVGSDNSCLECYKCFRKEGIRGRKLDVDNPDIFKNLIRILQKKPLKMAASTIYAIQKAGYTQPIFQRYMNIDVSWCERINEPITKMFNHGWILDFNNHEIQTENDHDKIIEFVSMINDDKLYKI